MLCRSDVAIIGAGLAGLATAKALTIRGLSCTVFEQSSRVGGLWAKAYPGALVQVSCIISMKFSHFKYNRITSV